MLLNVFFRSKQKKSKERIHKSQILYEIKPSIHFEVGQGMNLGEEKSTLKGLEFFYFVNKTAKGNSPSGV